MRVVLRSNKKLILSLAVLLLAGLGLVLGSSRLTADGDTLTTCMEDGCAVQALVEGIGPVQGELTGSTTVETQPSKADKRGIRTTPLEIKGSVMRGYLDGVGEMMLWLDKSRPIPGGVARSKQAGRSFPAVQQMQWHLLATLEAFPGRTFRSVEPFVVQSSHVNAMPPRDAVFHLAREVSLEDVDTGEVVVRLQKGRAVLNASDRGRVRGVDRFGPAAEDQGR